MPLDPQAQAALGHMREVGRRPFQHLTVQETRETAWAFVDLQGLAGAGWIRAVGSTTRSRRISVRDVRFRSINTSFVVKEQEHEHDN